QRRRDRSLGFLLCKRRQTVLEAFQVARHDDADHVRPRRQELAELEIGWAQPGQRPRQPRSMLVAAPFDEACELQRELSRRRHKARIDDAEYALAREHDRGAGKTRNVGKGRDHKRQPECSATMPPDKVCQLTREKPASRIMSAKALGFGNLRIDSTRYR